MSIKIENVDVHGWEAAIRGARNPMNSWDKCDSYVDGDYIEDEYESALRNVGNQKILTSFYELPKELQKYFIDLCTYRSLDVLNSGIRLGPVDHKLLMNLCKGGSEESKWRRFVNVSMDITAPLYWWKEFDTYKVGTACNSCSTMHKIQAKEFTLEDFSCEHLIKMEDIMDSDGGIPCDRLIIYDESKEDWGWSDDDPRYEDDYYGDTSGIGTWAEQILKITIAGLNYYRDKFLETKDKKYWWQMIQLLPTSYNQRRTIQLNYEVLAKQYRERKDHKLDEWHQYCVWIKTLPYSEFITMEENPE